MKKFIIPLAAAAFFLAACNKPVTEAEVLPHEDPDIPLPVALRLTPATLELGFEAGDADTTLVVSDVTSVEVSLSPDAASWLSLTVDGMVLRISVKEENPSTSPRTGIVTVVAGEGIRASSAELSVVQSGAPVPVLTLDGINATLEAKEASGTTLTITETNQKEISASVGSCDWLKAEIEGDKLKLTALSDNTSSDMREATVTIGNAKISVDIIVRQDGAAAVNKVGTAYGKDGIYFWRNPDNPKQYKVVSAKAEKRAWGSQVPCGISGTSVADSEEACAKIRALAEYKTSSFALQFCDAMGEGWHLPNYAEAENLFETYNGLRFDNKKGAASQKAPSQITQAEKDARAAFDAVMTSIGGVLLNTQAETENGDSFWLCSENSAGTNAYYFRVGNPGYNHGAKTSTARFARCIKVVNE